MVHARDRLRRNDSGATVLLIDDAFAPLTDAILAEARWISAVIHMGDSSTPADMIAYEHLVERTAPIPEYGGSGEDLAGIFYTGGTTGFPKGVMLSHRALWASAAAVNGQVPIHTRDSVCLHAAPLFHIGGFSYSMMSFLVGARQAIIPAFAPEHVLATIEEHRVTGVMLVRL